MDQKTKIQKIKEVLTSTGNLVLASSNKSGHLHICVMSYVLADDDSLLLSCEKASTKVRNIRENPRVGMSIFEKQEKPSLLIYGVASILKDEEAEAAYREIRRKAPHYKAFTHKNRCFFKIRIEKIIYEHYTKDKEEYFEIKLLNNNVSTGNF